MIYLVSCGRRRTSKIILLIFPKVDEFHCKLVKSVYFKYSLNRLNNRASDILITFVLIRKMIEHGEKLYGITVNISIQHRI